MTVGMTGVIAAVVRVNSVNVVLGQAGRVPVARVSAVAGLVDPGHRAIDAEATIVMVREDRVLADREASSVRRRTCHRCLTWTFSFVLTKTASNRWRARSR